MKPDKTKVWLLICIILFLSALFSGAKPFYALFYLYVLYLAVPRFLIARKLSALTGGVQVSSNKAGAGDKISVEFSITNRGLGSIPYLEVQTRLGEDFSQISGDMAVLSLRAKESFFFSREITCGRRGTYRIDALKVRASDIFDNFHVARQLSGHQYIRVYPQVERLDDLHMDATQLLGSVPVADRMFEDYSSLSALRKWVPGDTIKKIHWKAYAKTGNIIVKDFEFRGDARLYLVIDMSAGSYKKDVHHRLEDRVVDCAVTLLFAALERGFSISGLITDERCITFNASNLNEFDCILEHFVDLSPTGRQPVELCIVNSTAFSSSKTIVSVISPNLNLKMAEALLILKSSGAIPYLFLVTFEEPDNQISSLMARLSNENIKTVLVHPGQPLTGALAEKNFYGTGR